MQPQELPLLVFIKRVVGRRPARQVGGPNITLLCLDKRNGDKLYESDVLMSQLLRYETDVPAQMVSFDLGRKRLHFNFTNQPVELDQSETDESPQPD